MANVELPSAIQSISGKMGNFVFRTYKKADGTTVTRVYNASCYCQKQSRKISKKEDTNRTLFGEVNRLVALRMAEGDKRPRKEIYRELYAKLKAKCE